jgi:hypothetical protein
VQILGVTVQIFGVTVKIFGVTVQILGVTMQILGVTVQIFGVTVQILFGGTRQTTHRLNYYIAILQGIHWKCYALDNCCNNFKRSEHFVEMERHWLILQVEDPCY